MVDLLAPKQDYDTAGILYVFIGATDLCACLFWINSDHGDLGGTLGSRGRPYFSLEVLVFGTGLLSVCTRDFRSQPECLLVPL